MACSINCLLSVSTTIRPSFSCSYGRVSFNSWSSSALPCWNFKSAIDAHGKKKSLNTAGDALESKKYGGFLLTFIFALTPLPSNSYFLTLGTMKCNYFSVYFGFWSGRLISYAVTTMASTVVLTSLAAVFTSQLQAILLVDIISLLPMVVFIFIDWNVLLKEKRVKFIKPKFGRK